MHGTTTEPEIVLFRPGALGDTMLTIDAIAAIRRQFPGTSIELVGNADGGRLLAKWGLVERATRFDSAEITPLFGHPPQISERWLGARCAAFWMRDCDHIAEAFRAATGATAICASPDPDAAAEMHVADHLVETLRSILANGENDTEHELPEIGPWSADDWTGTPGDSVLLHPGSGSPRKNWPPARFAALAKLLIAEGRAVWMLSGPADDAAVAQVLDELDDAERRSMPVIRPTDVLDLARVLGTCAVFVGNDSGVAHVSARVGVPTLAIFGATEPLRWAPRGPRVLTLGASGDWAATEDAMQAIGRLNPDFVVNQRAG